MSRDEKRGRQDGQHERPQAAVPQELSDQIDHDRLPNRYVSIAG
jgi:hypothetical protein